MGDGVSVNGLDCPTGAVAYTEEAFNALIAEAGLQRVGDYARGAWSGFFKDAMDGQDIAILAKRSEARASGDPRRTDLSAPVHRNCVKGERLSL